MNRAHQHGFTLVEMMVSIAILAIVMLVMASTFLIGYKTINNEVRSIAANTAVSDSSLVLLRDLSSADALVPGTIDSSPGDVVSFVYGQGLGVVVTYRVDTNGNFIRTTAPGTATVAARGITRIVISASGCYATVTIQPSAQGASAATLNVSSRPAGCF